MRIVFVTTEFVTEDYFSGGLANYVHRLSVALADTGHDIQVIVASPHADESFVFGKVRIHRVRARASRVWARALLHLLPKAPREWLKFSAAAWRKLGELDHESPVHIVQVANLQACGLLIVAFSRVPHATRLSSLPEWEDRWVRRTRGPGDMLTAWLERLQLRLSQHVFAPSRTLASAAAAKAKIGSVDVLRSPAYIETEHLDHDWFRHTLGARRYLLFVGRLESRKGVEILAQALPAVFQKLPDCEAVFAGQDRCDSTGKSMKAHILRTCHPFQERVHVLGELPHPRLYPLMEGARLVVLPSLADNLPNAMLEAMSLGRPVVGTIGTTFDEVIEDGQSGFLVAPGDPHALATKIVLAWNHPELDRIGEGARNAMRPFAPEVTASRHVEYYERVVAAHG